MRFLIIVIALTISHIAMASHHHTIRCMNSSSYCERLLRQLPSGSYQIAENTTKKVVKTKRRYTSRSGTFVFDPRRLKWYAYNSSGGLIESLILLLLLNCEKSLFIT